MSDDRANYFGDLISLIKLEELMRLQWRAKKRNFEALDKILGDEIAERELHPSE